MLNNSEPSLVDLAVIQMRRLGAAGRIVDPRFLGLATTVVIFHLVFWNAQVLPIHHTQDVLWFVQHAATSVAQEGHLPYWFPYSRFGFSFVSGNLTALDPALMVATLIGGSLGSISVASLLRAAVLFDHLILLAGTVALGRVLFHRPSIAMLIGLAVTCTTVWSASLFSNFRLYYLVPLFAAQLMQADRTGDWRLAGRASFITALSMIGLPFGLAIPLMLLELAALTFVAARMGRALGLNIAASVRTLTTQRGWPVVAGAMAASYIAIFAIDNAGWLVVLPGSKAIASGFVATLGRVQAETAPLHLILAELLTAMPQRIEITLYAGLLPLALIMAALSLRPLDRRLVGILACAAITTLLALTGISFPLALIAHLSGQGEETISQLLVFLKLLILLGGGVAWDRLSTEWDKVGEAHFRFACPRFRLAIALLVVAALAAISQVMISAVPPPAGPARSLAMALAPNLVRTIPVLGVVTLVALALLILRAIGWRRPLGTAVVSGFMVFEFLSYGVSFNLAMPVKVPVNNVCCGASGFSVWEIPSEVGKMNNLPQPRIYVPVRGVLATQVAMPGVRQTLLARPGDESFLMNAVLPNESCSEHAELRGPVIAKSTAQAFFARNLMPVDTASFGFNVASFQGLPHPIIGDQPMMATAACGGPKLRAFTTAEAVAGTEAALTRIADLRGQLASTLSLESVSALPQVDPADDEPVHIYPPSRYSADNLSVSVGTLRPKGFWLYYADAFDVGWKAKIDDSPTQVYRAQGGFKAVHVPYGDHLIHFEFAPQPQGILLWLVVLGSLLGVSILTTELWQVANRPGIR